MNRAARRLLKDHESAVPGMMLEELIYAAYDDLERVHELLRILHRRKKIYIKSLKGARFDPHELPQPVIT